MFEVEVLDGPIITYKNARSPNCEQILLSPVMMAKLSRFRLHKEKQKRFYIMYLFYYSIYLFLSCFSCYLSFRFHFAKIRHFFYGYFVLFMSSFKYAQYSSNDLVIVSCGINRRRYSATIVGLNERLNVYSTDTRSADGHNMMPMVGFS